MEMLLGEELELDDDSHKVIDCPGKE